MISYLYTKYKQVYNSSVNHLVQAELNYTTHFRRASRIGCKMIYGGIKLVAHAIVPGCYEYDGSEMVKELYNEFYKKEE